MRCIHHWILETPNGQYAKGKCKKCNLIGEFRNAFEEIKRKRNGVLVADLSVSADAQRKYTQRESINAD